MSVRELFALWWNATRHYADPSDRERHPGFAALVALGEKALPDLFVIMEEPAGGYAFLVIWAILGEKPTEAGEGSIPEIIEATRKLGRKRGAFGVKMLDDYSAAVEGVRWMYTPERHPRVRHEGTAWRVLPPSPPAHPATRKYEYLGEALGFHLAPRGHEARKAILGVLKGCPEPRALVLWTVFSATKHIGWAVLVGDEAFRWEVGQGQSAIPTWANYHGDRSQPQDELPLTAYARLLE